MSTTHPTEITHYLDQESSWPLCGALPDDPRWSSLRSEVTCPACQARLGERDRLVAAGQGGRPTVRPRSWRSGMGPGTPTPAPGRPHTSHPPRKVSARFWVGDHQVEVSGRPGDWGVSVDGTRLAATFATGPEAWAAGEREAGRLDRTGTEDA